MFIFRIWKSCFPFVKLLAVKAVGMKCDPCCWFSEARKRTRDQTIRQELGILQTFHRAMFMGERRAYQKRKDLAYSKPAEYLSIISDGGIINIFAKLFNILIVCLFFFIGMAQGHSILPWQGNMQNATEHVKQHIQGVLVHGRAMFAYRTFHNLANTSNLQLTTLLLTLNWVIETEGRLPDTIFYQIDGGAENIADVVYAFCEMLVVSGLTKCVVVRFQVILARNICVSLFTMLLSCR